MRARVCVCVRVCVGKLVRACLPSRKCKCVSCFWAGQSIVNANVSAATMSLQKASVFEKNSKALIHEHVLWAHSQSSCACACSHQQRMQTLVTTFCQLAAHAHRCTHTYTHPPTHTFTHTHQHTHQHTHTKRTPQGPFSEVGGGQRGLPALGAHA